MSAHDVNESIVRLYFESRGFLVRTNVQFFKPKEKTGKQSSGYGDLDLVIMNPHTGEKAVVGVSAWHTERITPSYIDEWGHRIFNFVDDLALQKATEIFGTSDLKKILVVSRLGARPESRQTFIKKAHKKGVDEILEFPEILRDLVDYVKVKPSYDNEVLQIIRLLKIYELF